MRTMRHVGMIGAVLAALLLAGSPASAAVSGTWTKQSPVFTGATLNSVEALSSTEAWIAGTSGTVMHTSDGGATWTQQSVGTTEPIYKVAFKDAQHGWATSNNAVYFTTNGGATWTKGTGQTLGSIIGVGFADLSTGFATTGFKGMFKSTNGGASWTSVSTPIAVAGVQFFDASNGVISGPGGVMHTYDGGKTFTTITSPHGGFFLDHDHGWYLTEDIAQYTVDGGTTWKQASLPAGQWIYSGAVFADLSNGWAAGATEGIVHSSDGGKTWATQTIGGVNPLWAIDFSDNQHGLAVGNGGIILQTSDGGATWATPQSGAANQKNDLAVVDSLHAWSADSFGVIERTTDGGALWTPQQVGSTTSHFWGIDFVNSQVGWAVGDAEQSFSHGMIYGTKDGGQTWSLQFEGGPDIDQLYDVAALTTKIAVAVGNANTLLRTTDGGATWTEPAHPAVSVLSGVDFVGKVGYAVGNGSAILQSRDGGKTWTALNPNLPFGASLMDASFLTGGKVGWVVGFDGIVLKTTNAGRTWVDQGFGVESGLNVLGVDAIDANTVWISGYDNGNNYVARTTNGGSTWVEETIPQEAAASSISDVEFLNADEGWAAGYEGIFKRTA
jgi:photosystem II stability/assembly factor-like uncharacterized protein